MRAGRWPSFCAGVLLCGLVLLLGMRSGAAQDGAAGAGSDTAGPAQSVAVEPTAQDDKIADRISRIMRATGWYTGVSVSVEDGVVFIDGDTTTAEARLWAGDLARKTQDVVAVVNRVSVTPQVDWSFRPAVLEIGALIGSGIALLPLIVLAIVVIPLACYAAILVAKLVEWALSRRIESPFLRRVLARTAAIPVFLIGLYLVLQVAGLTRLAVSLLGGAGVIGIIVGFAFRDIAENFLASLLLSIRRPFRRGDYIAVSGHDGLVQSMNTRSTLLLSLEGNHIQIPNAAIFKSTIVNYSSAPARREVVDVGIGFDVSIAAAQEIILGVLKAHDAVIEDPEEPLVLVDSLGSATVNLRAYFWFDGRTHAPLKVKSALLRLIKKALMEGGISMPDEAREIIFPQGVPVISMPNRDAPAKPADTLPAPDQPTDVPAVIEEPEVQSTASEGDLGNDTHSLERQAARSEPVDPADDLLSR
ncbi:MAG: mechanosensitive ion channel family protein [Alphaproteobacteria bacterium]|nr:mechanosensitive ion channel family protein [Alphaproteobacteria bacterium]